MPGPYAAHVTEEEKRLDAALCNFCNQAGDPFEPEAQWKDYVLRELKELGAAYNEWYRMRIMDPAEREKMDRWKDACATASYVVDRFREDRKGPEGHHAESHLMRNIADAIHGVLKQTSADRKAGKTPETMQDRLRTLEANGDLVRLQPKKD